MLVAPYSPRVHTRARPVVRVGEVAAAWAVLAAMVGLSLVLWLGAPVAWLWIASQLTSSPVPALELYALVLAGLAATAALLVAALTRLDLLFCRLSGRGAQPRVPVPWLSSCRGERVTPRRTTVLAPVMVASVVTAAGGLALWFLVFAGSPVAAG